mgnify:CR=1 FL=1
MLDTWKIIVIFVAVVVILTIIVVVSLVVKNDNDNSNISDIINYQNLIFTNAIIFMPDGSWSQTVVDGSVVQGNNAQQKLDEIYALQKHTDDPDTTGEFNENRFALCFMPGEHTLSFNVGYYCSVIGMGNFPTETTINGTVNVPPVQDSGYLDNFFRNIENIHINVPEGSTEVFGTSQASPVRRCKFSGDLYMATEAGFSSGGYIANSEITQNLNFSTQQQFFTRNSSFQAATSGSWNFVNLNCQGSFSAPANICTQGQGLRTELNRKLPIREKPVLVVDNDGKYQILTQPLQKQPGIGTNWDNATLTDKFNFVDPSMSVESLNAFLALGINLVFTPGMYKLSSALHVVKSNTILLGVGFPTLINNGSEPAMIVHDGVQGVQIALFLFQAGTMNADALLLVGETAKSEGDIENPTVLQDVIARTVDLDARCKTMITVNQSNVIIDHTWLWRMDHNATIREGVGLDNAICLNGLVVNGDDVFGYGIFSEHHNEECVIWNGSGGTMLFLQCELAYEAAADPSWDFPGMRVTGNDFYGTNLAVYSFFANKWGAGPDYPNITNGFVVSNDAIIDSAGTLLLNKDRGSGQILHVINNNGQATNIMNADAVSWCGQNSSTPWNCISQCSVPF